MKIVFLLLAIHSALPRDTVDETKFLYLVQNKDAAELPFLKTQQSDFIQLVWKHPPLPAEEWPGVIYFPNSTILQRRNRLYAEFSLRFPHGGFNFLILVDGASTLEETRDYGLSGGHPWRTLERYLLEYEPAVASPHTDGCHPMPSERPSQHAYGACEHSSTCVEPNAAPEVEVVFDHDDGGVMAVHAQASALRRAAVMQNTPSPTPHRR